MMSLYKLSGKVIRRWARPKEFYDLRGWALWAWNEYDDWLYNGIHGFRILGFEFSTEVRWLDRLCWKLLPIFRFIARRPEYFR